MIVRLTLLIVAFLLSGCTYLEMEACEKLNHLPYHPVYDRVVKAWYEVPNK